MGIETALASRVEKEISEFPKITNVNRNSSEITVSTSNFTNSNSRRKSRRRNKKMAVVSPVQRLFDTCKHVFVNAGTGVIPSPDKIELLRAVLDVIRPEDVGVTPQMPYFRPKTSRRNPRVTYLHIYECDTFSMGIFCLPPSAVIPLHNHPGMTVFSKLLFGTMHIKSYDWVVDAPGQSAETRMAKVKVDSNFTAPCNTSILYPADGGNMHCFTAITACAVLDVLGPPYSDPEGRHCTYYFDFPFSRFTVDGVSIPEEETESHAWLKEREEKPEDFNVMGMMYSGPDIVEN